jgi:hypothetical protein
LDIFAPPILVVVSSFATPLHITLSVSPVHLKFPSERQIKRSVEWFDHTSDWLEVAVGRCTCGLIWFRITRCIGRSTSCSTVLLCFQQRHPGLQYTCMLPLSSMIWMKYAVGVCTCHIQASWTCLHCPGVLGKKDSSI